MVNETFDQFPLAEVPSIDSISASTLRETHETGTPHFQFPATTAIAHPVAGMSRRTFAIGDIHGDIAQLMALLDRLPELTPEDTLVFLGDYLDRGPHPAQVVTFLMKTLPSRCGARIVTLRGNHEDAWLKVRQGLEPMFPLVAGNGCMATLRSFLGGPIPEAGAFPSSPEEMDALATGSFFPADVVTWMEQLLYFYEDEHAIYVHGGLPTRDGAWPHPAQVADPSRLVWCRDDAFFRRYSGKRVVFGHTPATHLPQDVSSHTPLDLTDVYIQGDVIGIDTGCGQARFLSAVELPSMTIYESREGGARSGT